MSRRPSALTMFSIAARWPLGIVLTSWRYFWRTLPVHRRELTGGLPFDGAPELPADVDTEDLQGAADGVGPLVHRVYRTEIVGSGMSPGELLERVSGDLDAAAPSEFAKFHKVRGEDGAMRVGDEFVVRMPGPWDGPVRVIEKTGTSFRFATLDGHLEAGQIEFRALGVPRGLEFVIESWARSGDWLSNLMYTNLRMAKEVQLHMWTSFLQRVVQIAGGTMRGGVVITTRPVPIGERRERDRGRRSQDRLGGLAVIFDPPTEEQGAANGWAVEELTVSLPHEPSGPPVADGSWETATRLLRAHEFADPRAVRASLPDEGPGAGQDVPVEVRCWGVRLYVGVRVDEVYDDERVIGGRPVRIAGWSYRTLKGHFLEGRIRYEAWKWLDTGDVDFHLEAHSRASNQASLPIRLAFRLGGRHRQLEFYGQACRRIRRLTEAELETKHVQFRRASAVARTGAVVESSSAQAGAPGSNAGRRG